MAPKDTVILGSADDNKMAAFIARASNDNTVMNLDLEFQTWNTNLSGKYTITTYIEDQTTSDADNKLQSVSVSTGKTDLNEALKAVVKLNPKSVAFVIVEFNNK